MNLPGDNLQLQQALAERVVQARAMLQAAHSPSPAPAFAADLRALLGPLAADFGKLEFGARRKLLQVCRALDRLETQGLDRGARVRLDTDMLGLWMRIW